MNFRMIPQILMDIFPEYAHIRKLSAVHFTFRINLVFDVVGVNFIYSCRDIIGKIVNLLKFLNHFPGAKADTARIDIEASLNSSAAGYLHASNS